ncbi:MAG: ABC transporter ATP-binding protein [Chloroflexi bacterium]|nr:ABC transporter ATP-binding protein [Chloroflexota bacterium]
MRRLGVDILPDTHIDLEEVSVAFASKAGETLALENVSFAVQEGEFVSIVGPSGCGKSTILNVIAGLADTLSGRVSIKGKATNGIPKDIGYVFQSDLLLPWRTVFDNVALALKLRGYRTEKMGPAVEDWLTRVGLAGFRNHYPHQLSGGMRKRVALAQTLVYNPELILMDEPFSALDVQTRNMMENELLDLWSGLRKTVLFVTHDLEEAVSLSDRIILLTARPGRVKASYIIDLPRPRNVTEVRFNVRFRELIEQIWQDLKTEVTVAYAASRQ